MQHTYGGRAFYRRRGDDASVTLDAPVEGVVEEKVDGERWFEERWRVLNSRPPAAAVAAADSSSPARLGFAEPSPFTDTVAGLQCVEVATARLVAVEVAAQQEDTAAEIVAAAEEQRQSCAAALLLRDGAAATEQRAVEEEAARQRVRAFEEQQQSDYFHDQFVDERAEAEGQANGALALANEAVRLDEAGAFAEAARLYDRAAAALRQLPGHEQHTRAEIYASHALELRSRQRQGSINAPLLTGDANGAPTAAARHRGCKRAAFVLLGAVLALALALAGLAGLAVWLLPHTDLVPRN